ncbi:unnamed protein product [Mytilus edulis]|uniref:Uncharacterized protein n=1 Tax=Mytilus edulis TaxID=6550 RepID=A0A8S3VE68_MYTED|nr:unnamed protein product [Mytilus edulis]
MKVGLLSILIILAVLAHVNKGEEGRGHGPIESFDKGYDLYNSRTSHGFRGNIHHYTPNFVNRNHNLHRHLQGHGEIAYRHVYGGGPRRYHSLGGGDLGRYHGPVINDPERFHGPLVSDTGIYHSPLVTHSGSYNAAVEALDTYEDIMHEESCFEEGIIKEEPVHVHVHKPVHAHVNKGEDARGHGPIESFDNGYDLYSSRTSHGFRGNIHHYTPNFVNRNSNLHHHIQENGGIAYRHTYGDGQRSYNGLGPGDLGRYHGPVVNNPERFHGPLVSDTGSYRSPLVTHSGSYNAAVEVTHGGGGY